MVIITVPCFIYTTRFSLTVPKCRIRKTTDNDFIVGGTYLTPIYVKQDKLMIYIIFSRRGRSLSIRS